MRGARRFAWPAAALPPAARRAPLAFSRATVFLLAMAGSVRPVFRFAPSPNGRLHLGHAYSALLNEQMASAAGGRLLLRIEDIDRARCTPEFEQAIIADLDWLAIRFDGAPARQSDRGAAYGEALGALAARGLVYPCWCSRAQIAARAGGLRDPDGSPPHVGRCAGRAIAGREAALRLDLAAALAAAGGPLFWREYGDGTRAMRQSASPADWGDVLIKRADALASYHLAVVIDDGAQGVSDVVRGRDLFHATSVHRLLQDLLGLAPPRYRHHRLVRDASGAKMSKSARSMTLAHLRSGGAAPGQIRAMLGFGRDQLTLAATAAPDEGAGGAALGAWAIS
jgi:glutamyl-Q tRNA(Asp) synthetase